MGNDRDEGKPRLTWQGRMVAAIIMVLAAIGLTRALMDMAEVRAAERAALSQVAPPCR